MQSKSKTTHTHEAETDSDGKQWAIRLEGPAKQAKGIKGHKLLVIEEVSHRDVMCSIGNIVSNCV